MVGVLTRKQMSDQLSITPINSLNVQTKQNAALTWTVSNNTVTLKDVLKVEKTFGLLFQAMSLTFLLCL